MKSLPLPIRVAAGLAVTAVEQARTLPAKIAGLPVTVASQALQVSMRVQQQVTELAIRGDEVLAGLRPVEDTPEWATFDEDVDDGAFDLSKPAPFESAFDRVEDESDRRNGHHTETGETFATSDPWAQEEQALAEETSAHETDEYGGGGGYSGRHHDGGFGDGQRGNGGLGDDGRGGGGRGVGGRDGGPSDDGPGVGRRGVGEPGDGGLGDSGHDGWRGDSGFAGDGDGGQGDGGFADGGNDGRGDGGFVGGGRGEGAGDGGVEPGDSGRGDVELGGDRALLEADRSLPEAAGYDELSLPQLRARLRRFSADELAELLEYERAHGNRPSYVGMLTRRIATVRDQR